MKIDVKHGNPVTSISGLQISGQRYNFCSPIRINFPSGVRKGRDMETLDWRVVEFKILYDYTGKKASVSLPFMPVYSRSSMRGNF